MRLFFLYSSLFFLSFSSFGQLKPFVVLLESRDTIYYERIEVNTNSTNTWLGKIVGFKNGEPMKHRPDDVQAFGMFSQTRGSRDFRVFCREKWRRQSVLLELVSTEGGQRLYKHSPVICHKHHFRSGYGETYVYQEGTRVLTVHDFKHMAAVVPSLKSSALALEELNKSTKGHFQIHFVKAIEIYMEEIGRSNL